MSENIKASDINGWWNKLNDIRTRLGQSPISYTSKTSNDVVKSNDMTAIKTEFDTMKTDTYYRYATYMDIGDTSVGAICRLPTKSAIDETLNSVENIIKCRNTISHSNSTKSNGDQSNGDKSNGSKSNGTRSYSSHSNGTKSNSYWSNTSNSIGSQSHGNYSNGDKSNGTCNNGSNSYQSENNGSCTNGYNSYGTTVDVSNVNK